MKFLEPGRVKTGLLKDIYDVPHLSRHVESKALINRIHQNTHIATSTLLESKGSRIKIIPPLPPLLFVAQSKWILPQEFLQIPQEHVHL